MTSVIKHRTELAIHMDVITGSLKRSYHSNIQNFAPRRQTFKIYSQAVWCLTSLRFYRTTFAWSQLQQKERQWQRAYRRRPTPLELKKKNDRDRSTLTTGNSLRVISSRRSIPGKIWMPTNQIGSTLAGARVYRQLRARALQASRGI